MSEAIDPIAFLKDQFSQNGKIEFNPDSKQIDFQSANLKLPKDT